MMNNFSKNTTTAFKKTLQNRRVQEGMLVSASVATLVASGPSSPSSGKIDYNIVVNGKLEQGSTLSAVLQKPDHFSSSPYYYEPGYADTAQDHYYVWTFEDAIGGSEDIRTDNNTFTLTNDQVGKTVYVTYVDYRGQGDKTLFAPIANINDTPTGNVSIGTSIEARQKLTADTSKLVDIDGLGTLHYQWKVGGVNVGTDAKTYVTTTADIGKTVSVDVSYTDLGGNFAGAIGTSELVSSNIIPKILASKYAEPVFASSSALKVSVFENSNSGIAVTATDPDSPTLAYSLTGVDKDLFNIDSNGIVTFKTAPDFENPKDAGGTMFIT